MINNQVSFGWQSNSTLQRQFHNCQKLLSWCWVGSHYLAHLASSSWLPTVICPRYGADISQRSWLTWVIQSFSPGKSFFSELYLLLCSFLFSLSSQTVTLKGRQNFTHIKNTILFPDPRTEGFDCNSKFHMFLFSTVFGSSEYLNKKLEWKQMDQRISREA